MTTFTRQPFGELGSSRLQALQSAKNKQNAPSPTFATPLKPSPTASTGKRQRAPEIFEDDSSENIDPSRFCTPTKRSKTFSEAGFVKPAAFSLFTAPLKPTASLTTTPTLPSVRKALSSPNTAKSTPISTSRGSPKNKRVHAISKRRASSSPFRRVDPPFAQNSNNPALPFSIDAALSGSIPTYTPKPKPVAVTPVAAPQHAATPVEDTMPKAWFFAIHEDTPEQESANLMEHSASVLDISSDDDAESKRRNEELSRGKENVPPPEWVAAQQARLVQPSNAEEHVDDLTKRPRLRKFVQDAMDEDRRPLGDLPPCEFYAAGCDATTYVTVDAGIERPSGLSRECDFSIAADEEVDEVAVAVAPVPAPAESVVEAATADERPAMLNEVSVAVDADANIVAATLVQESIAHVDVDATSPPQETPATAS